MIANDDRGTAHPVGERKPMGPSPGSRRTSSNPNACGPRMEKTGGRFSLFWVTDLLCRKPAVDMDENIATEADLEVLPSTSSDDVRWTHGGF